MIKTNSIGFIIYFIAGLYLMNSAFSFITIPEVILGVQKWIFAAIGALLLFAGIKYLMQKKMPGIR